jgi:organic radical activating enzyme
MVSSKRTDETYTQYQQRVLDSKSASFCGAKWYNATIWLGSGQTTSCHHPLPHTIDLEQIKTNPSAIHNTREKKQQRLEMQQGQRPSGCEYCWRLEDAGTTSDRVHKSKIFSEAELQQAYESDADTDVNLRTLEISFDRTCQFACSYCNPAFSSTWAKDIKTNGAYRHLISDGRNHYTHEHAASQKYGYNEDNPYAEAFFRWWQQGLHQDLRELRLTGGEPLMSGYTWRLLDWFRDNRTDCALAINTNLGFDADKLNDFLDKTRDIPHLEVYTSNEALSNRAEYIRDGLDYQQWHDNLVTLIKAPHVKGVHVMATINGLCLSSLPMFLIDMCRLKEDHGRDAVSFTLNILRFPSFQSPTVLPAEIRRNYSHQLSRLLDMYDETVLHDMEREHITRLSQYLESVEIPHAGASPRQQLEHDFKNFYQQYDRRRGKNFVKTFPEFKEWYEQIQL